MTSKISFCIMFAVVLPLSLHIDWVLKTWLDKVPEYSNTFAILFFINGIINAISMPFNFTVLSSSDIRNFQIATAIVFMLDIPIAYLLFVMGMPAISVLWVKIFVISIMFFVRVFYASRIVNSITLWSVCREVLFPMLVTFGGTLFLAFLLKTWGNTTAQKIVFTLMLEFICLVMMWLLCLTKQEKTSLIKMIKRGK